MTREQKRERMRRLGRALVVGNRQTIVEVLDAVIEPRNPIWERISDIAIGYVVDALLSGREDLVDGAREALDQLEGWHAVEAGKLFEDGLAKHFEATKRRQAATASGRDCPFESRQSEAKAEVEGQVLRMVAGRKNPSV